MRAVKEVAAGLPEGSRGPAQKALGYPARVRQFLHDVRLELRNVTWPSWNDVKSTTVVVLIATFFFGFYLGMFLDYPLGWVMRSLLLWGRTLVQ